MYLRSKLQPRSLKNLELFTLAQDKFRGMRVTKGYVVTYLLNNYPMYIRDAVKLHRAIEESDIKCENSTPVNLNITLEANEKLNNLKALLDKETGRSLFPAQIIDILLICALNAGDEPPVKEIPDKVLAKVLMEYAYKLLTEDILPANIANARPAIVKALTDSNLL